MDAVEYVKARWRMCEKYRYCCDCPLGSNCGESLTDPEGNVKAVEEWAKEHQPKTRQSEFLKMFPKANVLGEAMNIRPCDVDTDAFKGCANFITCFHCMRKYWSEEIE